MNQMYSKAKIVCLWNLVSVRHTLKLVFLLLLLSQINYSVQAQIKNETFNSLHVTYFGKSVTRPGLKAGTDLLSYGFRNHIQKDGDATSRQLMLSSNLGFYYHFRNHYGLFLNSEFNFRTTYTKGFFWQFGVGVGYLRTFLDAQVYEVDNNGEIRRLFFAGNNQFMPSATVMLGKDYTEPNKPLKTFFCQFGCFLQYPYNTMWLPNLTLEVGISINLKNKNSI